MGDMGCLVPRVIVDVHREQARSYSFFVLIKSQAIKNRP